VMDTISDRSYQLRLIALGIRRGVPPEKIGADILDAVADYLDWLEEELWIENERLRDEVHRARTRAGDGEGGAVGEQEDDGYMPADTEAWTRYSADRRHDQVLYAAADEDPSTLDTTHATAPAKGEAVHDKDLAHRAKRSEKSN